MIQVNYRLDGVGNRPDSKLTGLKDDSQRLDNACHMVHVTPYKFDDIIYSIYNSYIIISGPVFILKSTMLTFVEEKDDQEQRWAET